LDGKKIEYEVGPEYWVNCVDHSWSLSTYRYRIKEPRWKDITVNEALELLKTGPKRARFSDDKKDWVGSEDYPIELTGLNICNSMPFLGNNAGYAYCQILEEA
jgi:hypothetical protein